MLRDHLISPADREVMFYRERAKWHGGKEHHLLSQGVFEGLVYIPMTAGIHPADASLTQALQPCQFQRMLFS